MKNEIKNIDQLRNAVLGVFGDVRAKRISIAQAKEMNNAAGKAQATIKIEYEYAAARKEMPYIPFVDYPKAEKK